MKNNIVNWKLVIGSIGVGVWSLFLLIPPSALAISSVSFGVYPPKISITTRPNQTIKVPLKIINGGELDTFAFSSSPISADLFGTINLSSQPDEASSWLTIENKDLSKSQVKLNANEETALTLEIKVPKNTLENDHYISLVVSSKNEETSDSTFVKSIAQIAIPIILSIKEGSEPESLIVEEFSMPNISFSSEVPVALKLKNPGKFLVETIGTITAKSLGQTKAQEVIPKAPILSGSSRYLGQKGYRFKTKSFGPTTITVSITLDQSKPLTISKSVFIVPLPALIMIVSLITILAISISKKFFSRTPKKP